MPPPTEEERKKKEKILSRIEAFEKRLPMRKLTIKEWQNIVVNCEKNSEGLTTNKILNSIQQIKGDPKFWKENILDPD